MSHLIQPSELATLSDCLVFDCRFSLTDANLGRQQYEQGHIPGAQYAHLNLDLADLSDKTGKGGRHPLPSREAFINRVSQWGIENKRRVVCYDQDTGAYAARMWWMLRWLGHSDVQVLDGGFSAWKGEGLPVSTDETQGVPSVYIAEAPLTRLVSAEDMFDREALLLDARDPARFRGEVEPIDAIAGHIPHAYNAPFLENLKDGQFLSSKELRNRFTNLGVESNSDVYCYCGSGVTAAHNILALLLAGFSEPALYPGSWSQWITDPAHPIETGEHR